MLAMAPGRAKSEAMQQLHRALPLAKGTTPFGLRMGAAQSAADILGSDDFPFEGAAKPHCPDQRFDNDPRRPGERDAEHRREERRASVLLVRIGATTANQIGRAQSPWQWSVAWALVGGIGRVAPLTRLDVQAIAPPGYEVAASGDTGLTDACAVLRTRVEACALSKAANQRVGALAGDAAPGRSAARFLAFVSTCTAVVRIGGSIPTARSSRPGVAAPGGPGSTSRTTRARGTGRRTARITRSSAGTGPSRCCRIGPDARASRARQAVVARAVAVTGAGFATARAVPRGSGLAAGRDESSAEKTHQAGHHQASEKLTQTHQVPSFADQVVSAACQRGSRIARPSPDKHEVEA